MGRKKRDHKRHVLPDPKFGERVITKAVNVLMEDGKKSVVERMFYEALEIVATKTNEGAVESFNKALQNIKPSVEVRSRRVGGATYQVPTEVRSDRAESLALRWLKEASNARTERRLAERVANELIDAISNRGIAVKKREDTHKMAEANKAFAHFRW
jgi:small subunit ribosomal protein S7